jgi:hypothetical protein
LARRRACLKTDSPGTRSLNEPDAGLTICQVRHWGYAQVTKSKRKGVARPKPITAHRLFPAFAALWCAALFGLVSFVLPIELLQRLVVASGLPHVVAAAAPPLGFTARALVALLLTGAGGLLGLIIGLRLRARHRSAVDETERDDLAGAVPPATHTATDTPAPRVRARDAHPDAPPRRPLVVSADMIDEAETTILADDAVLPARRRALVAPDSLVPAQPLAVAEADPAEHLLPGNTEFAHDAFDPFAIYETEAEQDEPFVPPAFLAEALGAAANGDPAPAEPAVAPAAPAVEARSAPVEAVAEAVGLDEDSATDVAAAPEPAGEPVAAESEDAEETEEPTRPLAPVTPSLFAMAREAMGEGARSPVAQADLGGLGLVQLVERLALAIADHRRALDSAQEDTALSPQGESAVQPALSPTQSLADAVTAPLLDTPAGQPGDVLAMPRLHRIGPADLFDRQAGGDAGAPGAAGVLEDRYSSLLDMAAAVRRADSARHGLSSGAAGFSAASAATRSAATPQPVVIFPGQGRAQRHDGDGEAAAPAAPFERPYLAAVPSRFQPFADDREAPPADAESTEQALRDALATLQRMTANR